MNFLDKAKRKLLNSNHTFVCINEDTVFTSEKQGVAPIMELLHKDEHLLKGAYIADRVIGKAAALLLIKGEIKELYADIISEHAMLVLKKSNIIVSYGKLVPYIENRKKDGMCPMEETVLNIESPEEAYVKLHEKIQSMQTNAGSPTTR